MGEGVPIMNDSGYRQARHTPSLQETHVASILRVVSFFSTLWPPSCLDIEPQLTWLNPQGELSNFLLLLKKGGRPDVQSTHHPYKGAADLGDHRSMEERP